MASQNVGVPFHEANLRPFGAPPSKGRREKAQRICAERKHPHAADAVPLPHAGKAYKGSQSPVIPLISGEWIVSHVWHEILRLSPHLCRLGLFTHRAFSSAQDDDTGERMGSYLGDMLRVLELAVLYYDTSSPLREGARQRRRMDPRSDVKNYVRLLVFHLSSRPKWRDPSCRAVNRERGKDEKGSTKVSFE